MFLLNSLIYHDFFIQPLHICSKALQRNHPQKTNWNVVWNVSLGVANRTEIYLTSDSVTCVGYNTPTAGSRLVLTSENKNHHHLCHPCEYMQSWARNISSSGTGTRLYMNGLCVTATEKVTNLLGFISLEEIKLFKLVRNTNFISVWNSLYFFVKNIIYWFIVFTAFQHY